MGPVQLYDLLTDDGVADREVGAHQTVQIERPDLVVFLVEAPVDQLEPGGLRVDDVTALFEDGGKG